MLHVDSLATKRASPECGSCAASLFLWVLFSVCGQAIVFGAACLQTQSNVLNLFLAAKVMLDGRTFRLLMESLFMDGASN
jgi:hypothetical protein